MATKKSYAEKIAEIEFRESVAKQKIAAIKAEKKRLQNRERELDRKRRTKRLIEIGATVEHAIGRPVDAAALQNLQNLIIQLENRDHWLSVRLWPDEKK